MSDDQIVDTQETTDTTSVATSDQAPESQAPAAESAAPSEAATQETSSTPSPESQGESQAPAGAKPALQTDPLKEFNDFKAQAGRELAETRRQLQQFQQQTLTFQQAEAKRAQEAERLSLKRWSPKHPDHHKFGATMAKRQALSSQLQAIKDQPGMTPESFQATARALTDAALSPDEQAELQEHHQMNQDFLMNPLARAEEIAEQVAVRHFNQMIQQFQQHGQAQTSVQSDLGSLPPAALPAMKEALESGASYDMALKYANMQARLSKLEGSQQQVAQRSSQSAEQLRLSKSIAQTTRDPKPAALSGHEVYQKAKAQAEKQGISTASPQFVKLLNKIEAESKAL